MCADTGVEPIVETELHRDVRFLNQIVLDLDNDVRADLINHDDLVPDLVAWSIIEEARRNLAVLSRDLENKLARAMPEKTVETPAGTFERSKKKNRTQWDREALLPDVQDSRLFDRYDGSLIEETPLDKVLAVWNLGAPRITVLRDRGLDPENYCHSEDAGYALRLSTT